MTYDAESASAEIESLWTNVDLLADRVRHVEKCLDTLQTPIWKRLWWWLYEGWPLWNFNAPQRQYRPWYRER